MPWNSFRVNLPKGTNWKNATVTVFSVWGNGNNAGDHWGYPGMAEANISRALKDEETGTYYLLIDLVGSTGSDPENGHYLAFTARLTLKDGKFATIAATYVQNSDIANVATMQLL